MILNTFSEVATGEKVELEIRTISSSELLVYLEAAAPWAVCLAIAVERIVALYKKLLEIKRLQQDIKKYAVLDDVSEQVAVRANQIMEEGIEEVVKEIMGKYGKKIDRARKNELTNSVKISLRKLANRIDKGFNVEVRVAPREADSQAEEVDPNLTAAIAAIREATSNMQYLRVEGEPILALPETTDKPKKKE